MKTKDTTPDSYTFDPGDSVRILTNQTALAVLDSDLRDFDSLFAWLFLVDEKFFTDHFAPHLDHSPMYVIVDDHQKGTARTLLRRHRRLAAWSWSANATMHDKTLLFPNKGVTWLTTCNLTRGSWTRSFNRAARIESHALTSKLLEQFNKMTSTAKRLTPKTTA